MSGVKVPFSKLVLPIGGTAFVLASLIGTLAGVGAYTFDYAEGTSYLSTDPAACNNCHIMNDQYASWSRGPHHHVAGCIDCHLPHDFVGKYVAKAENGWNHSKAFTLQNFHEPIMITPKNARILQESCLSCHADFMHEVVPGSRTTDAGGVQCVHCHRSAGHGPAR